MQNVVIDHEGHCKIIDFGLAKKVRSTNSSIEPTKTCKLDSH